jgi:hypothetical protein
VLFALLVQLANIFSSYGLYDSQVDYPVTYLLCLVVDSHWPCIVVDSDFIFCCAQGDADSSLDRLWQKKKAEIKQ